MEIDFSDNPNWLFDYGLDDISPISAGIFPAGFIWPSHPFDISSTNVSSGMDCSFGDSESIKEAETRKRAKPETCSASGSKASRDKLRREKLNERFLELGYILEPGRPPKADKIAILRDAVQKVNQLRNETEKLKESNKDLQEKIKELKAEKNELRDEKQRMKGEKEKLMQHVKSSSAQPSFVPHPSTMQAAFVTAQPKDEGNKMMSFIGYPGFQMWQVMSPAVIDTSKDHVLRPPVA